MCTLFYYVSGDGGQRDREREKWNTVKQKQNGVKSEKKEREKHLSIKKRENVILL